VHNFLRQYSFFNNCLHINLDLSMNNEKKSRSRIKDVEQKRDSSRWVWEYTCYNKFFTTKTTRRFLAMYLFQKAWASITGNTLSREFTLPRKQNLKRCIKNTETISCSILNYPWRSHFRRIFCSNNSNSFNFRVAFQISTHKLPNKCNASSYSHFISFILLSLVLLT